MKQYLEILQKIVNEGVWKQNRTGIKTKSITGAMFEHDMKLGFPALTTKKLAFKTMAVELEGFIKGIYSKKWFQERGCHIWDSWCNPMKVPYGNDELSKSKMKEEDDLGRIYGVQWREWWKLVGHEEYEKIDQFKMMIEKLKSNPLDRRNIVTAWNPLELDQMALVPCHYSFQVLSDGTNVDLLWNQRSNDFPLGNPFNIASYGLLLELIGKETGLIPNKLIGFLADVHIYENQYETVLEQLKREPLPLPKLEIKNFTNIFHWTHEQVSLIDYNHHPKLDYPIAV